ncbi:MAG: phosphoglycerate dehydrogenase [Candidatus Brocadiaceae bacterium]|nr:phosphoglycerate dehydrogenase [Candidatus Brocadiaceae bacterium]
MKTVLLADKLPEECRRILEAGGLTVVNRPGLSEDELKQAVRGVSGIVCRSGVRITCEVLQAADVLEAICRAGVGVDNVDVAAASRRGVAVMNTPGGNAVSTAEHTFALLLGLARKIGPAYISMRSGAWNRSQFLGSQLAGSTLGVIGFGRVGQEVSRRAIAFGMRVCVHDPFVGPDTAAKLGVQLVDELPDLLRESDYVTLHVPENDKTRGMIGAEQVAMMKPGACIINCARGSVLDQATVLAALNDGRLGGLAVDVYPTEPPESFEFVQNDKVLATPHLGASTHAAQLAVAVQAAEQMVDALQRRHYRNAVNIGTVAPEEMKVLRPYCDLAVRIGKLVAQISTGRPERLEVSCRGEIAEGSTDPIVSYGAMGVMQGSLGDDVNIVSAPHLAAERRVRITGSATVGLEAGFANLVEISLVTDAGTFEAAGTVFAPELARIVRIDGFMVELAPVGDVLILHGNDVPGVIGKVGAILGAGGVNIARMTVGRHDVGGKTLLALNVDTPCTPACIDRLVALPEVDAARSVHL